MVMKKKNKFDILKEKHNHFVSQIKPFFEGESDLDEADPYAIGEALYEFVNRFEYFKNKVDLKKMKENSPKRYKIFKIMENTYNKALSAVEQLDKHFESVGKPAPSDVYKRLRDGEDIESIKSDYEEYEEVEVTIVAEDEEENNEVFASKNEYERTPEKIRKDEEFREWVEEMRRKISEREKVRKEFWEWVEEMKGKISEREKRIKNL